MLYRGRLKVATCFRWHLEVWAAFSCHDHFVVHSPPDPPTAESLPAMLSKLHKKTALWVNHLDHAPGRQVWFN